LSSISKVHKAFERRNYGATINANFESTPGPPGTKSMYSPVNIFESLSPAKV